MTDRTSPVSGVAERYAAALFELARDDKALVGVEASLDELRAMLGASEDLRRMVRSPVIPADEQAAAIAALADKAGLEGLAANFVRLLARNRRLFALPDIITAFKAMAAAERGVVTADVTSARALSDDQTAALKDALKASLGKDVAISAEVDPAILGGLIVKVGSRMIDSSLRTKLNAMTTQLKRAS